MELKPPPLPRLPTPGLPLVPARDPARLAAKAGTDFEALLVTRLLKTARSAQLGDDLLGTNDQLRDLVDETRGRAIAQAAPLGLARLLAREAAK